MLNMQHAYLTGADQLLDAWQSAQQAPAGEE